MCLAAPVLDGGVSWIVLEGDNLGVLKTFPANSLDSVVTDPPYGLGKEPNMWEILEHWMAEKEYVVKGKGFMGREWDAFIPGPHVWKEVFRVLKPGGHLLTFSGTKTIGLMDLSVRLAGFESRDTISVDGVLRWNYGCLSEDAEILTESGWKPGVEVRKGDKVAAWDPVSEKIRFSPIQQHLVAPFEGELICFKNDNTDQLLTPNHRVYKKHRIRKQVNGVRTARFEESWTVQEAGEINRWEYLNLPLAGFYEGSGIGGVDLAALLGWVWTEGGFDKTGTGVRIYQSSVNPQHVVETQALLDRLYPEHKSYTRDRVYKGRSYTETCWFFTGPLAKWVRDTLPGKHPSWELLWNLSRAEQDAFVDAALKGDGSVGSHDTGTLYQKDTQDLVWFQTLAHLRGMQGRINLKKSCCGLHNNPTTQLQGRHLKSKSTEPYSGLVWCVRVETGAFLARRAGKIFITGNSGFPKSQNVSKFIDKAAGAEREVLGVSPNWGDSKRNREKDGSMEVRGKNAGLVTAPATPEAEQWDGWGTALKPAWEPVLVFRKPLEGTVATNVLKHGTGALNIDACRVETQDNPNGGAYAENGSDRYDGAENWRYKRKGGAGEYKQPEGRWPANLVLCHLPECERVGTKKVRPGNGSGVAGKRSGRNGYDGGRGAVDESQGGFVGADGNETVADWQCAEGCPVAVLGEQSGTSKSQGGSRGAGGQHGKYSPIGAQPDFKPGIGDEGTAARFFPQFEADSLYCAKTPKAERTCGGRVENKHPTVKPTKLMQWLVRLVTPPGGVVLDPFCGSGTTGCASILEGFRFIGIDSNAEKGATDIARSRIELVVEMGEEAFKKPPKASPPKKKGGEPDDDPVQERAHSTLDLFAMDRADATD